MTTIPSRGTDLRYDISLRVKACSQADWSALNRMNLAALCEKLTANRAKEEKRLAERPPVTLPPPFYERLEAINKPRRKRTPAEAAVADAARNSTVAPPVSRIGALHGSRRDPLKPPYPPADLSACEAAVWVVQWRARQLERYAALWRLDRSPPLFKLFDRQEAALTAQQAAHWTDHAGRPVDADYLDDSSGAPAGSRTGSGGEAFYGTYRGSDPVGKYGHMRVGGAVSFHESNKNKPLKSRLRRYGGMGFEYLPCARCGEKSLHHWGRCVSCKLLCRKCHEPIMDSGGRCINCNPLRAPQAIQPVPPITDFDALHRLAVKGDGMLAALGHLTFDPIRAPYVDAIRNTARELKSQRQADSKSYASVGDPPGPPDNFHPAAFRSCGAGMPESRECPTTWLRSEGRKCPACSWEAWMDTYQLRKLYVPHNMWTDSAMLAGARLPRKVEEKFTQGDRLIRQHDPSWRRKPRQERKRARRTELPRNAGSLLERFVSKVRKSEVES